MDLAPDLAALNALGGFFVLRTTVDPSAGPATALPTLGRAYAGTTADDRDPLADPMGFRVRKVATALRAPEARIAASIAHLGLAARLWSTALGCAVLYGRIPDLDPRLLRWDPDAGAPDDLWLTEVRSLPADASTVADVVVDAHLAPLEALLRTRHGLASGLLRGNAASALAGAVRELDRWARAAGRAEAAARTRALAGELLARPRLAGTGTLEGTAFRRRSCCLYYRVPGGGLCGDCCFTRPPGPSPRAASG
ncbi:(2Fe-2S)-binding protein [Streptomyces cadmiisoli]|uniref:Ferric iron reductase n=1 Tax=Streptomyces cadmiisoli TaxID=2184053 RepID=A0A2Z4ITJ1_9ACTN|nr:(2Fe-2S)-binding protein [Streptomyces cadmiisoli]AWW36431.1 ferric iron reductase [Streptomyces cadmiisoli]